MKNNFFIFTLFLIFLISCSEKNVTLRRIEDINKAEKKLAKNPKNEEALLEVLNAAQNGNREVRAEAMWVLSNLETEIAYSDFLKASVEDPDCKAPCIRDSDISHWRFLCTTHCLYSSHTAEVQSLHHDYGQDPMVYQFQYEY